MTGPATIESSQPLTELPAAAMPVAKKRRIWRAALFLSRWVIGAILVQSVFTAFLVLGWTLQLMRREFAKNFCRRLAAKGEAKRAFQEWAGRNAPELENWPGWILGSKQGSGGQRIRTGLIRNIRSGAAGWFNVFIITAPGCFLMLSGWYDGWNNSFNKGYEQALVGPLTVWAGMAWLIAMMFYVPLAQARQAATGCWRRFFDFRFVWRIGRRQRVLQSGLAFAYLAAGIPVLIAFSAPQFFGANNEELASLSVDEARSFLWTYFAWAGLFLFPLFVILKLMAARIYAGGILRGLREGWLSLDRLEGIEMSLAKQAMAGGFAPAPGRAPLIIKVGRMAWNAPVGAFLGLLIAILWLGVVAQVVIGQFIMYRPVQGWMNHPLIHLPWFSYQIPNHEAGEELPVTRLSPQGPE